MRMGCLSPAFSWAEKWAEMLHNPWILGGPHTKRGKVRIGCLTPAVSGAPAWAEMLHNPYIPGVPKQRGTS